MAPWALNILHRRLLTALAARAVERAADDEQFRCARLTIDLFRAATLDPVVLTATAVRDGRRVKVLEVALQSGER